jgi:hypothetical protein
VTTVIGTAEPCPHNPAHPVMTGLGAYAPGTRLDKVLAGLAAT